MHTCMCARTYARTYSHTQNMCESLLIGSVCRGFLVRTRLRKMLLRVDQLRNEWCARRIQFAWRRRMEFLKNEREMAFHRAAEKLQRHWRGFVVRAHPELYLLEHHRLQHRKKNASEFRPVALRKERLQPSVPSGQFMAAPNVQAAEDTSSNRRNKPHAPHKPAAALAKDKHTRGMRKEHDSLAGKGTKAKHVLMPQPTVHPSLPQRSSLSMDPATAPAADIG